MIGSLAGERSMTCPLEVTLGCTLALLGRPCRGGAEVLEQG